MAGTVISKSNPDLEALTEALARFAQPRHPEKSVEELEALVKQLRGLSKKRKLVEVPRIHDLEQRLGSDVLDTLVVRYSSGESATKIARENEISPSAFLRLLRVRGVTVRETKLTHAAVIHGAALYEKGMTVLQVANELHASKSTVLKALKDFGVVLRPKGRPRRELPERQESVPH